MIGEGYQSFSNQRTSGTAGHNTGIGLGLNICKQLVDKIGL